MFVWVVSMEVKETEVGLDRNTMLSLRNAVGERVFDELIEDVIFEVTERISRLEQLNREADLAAMAPIAHDLVAVAGQIGMSGVSDIAAGLEACCRNGATVSAQAIAHRLIRVGEASLVAAAEMSVEVGRRPADRHAI